MEKFSRYTDDKGRLFIVLAKYAKPIVTVSEYKKSVPETKIIEGKKVIVTEIIKNKKVTKWINELKVRTDIKLEPTTIDLLNVNAEKMETVKVSVFEKYIEQNLLKRIANE